jgi:hypothetical protein
MKKNSQRAAALIVALGKKPKMDKGGEMGPDMESDDMEEGEMDEGKVAAADDIISALDNKDAEALAAALDAFMDCR